ncbi:hypothetical protein Sme01_19810 [Sphaerisporangium melleum]|uniref:Secreted protein n=1 Tax=Sphaerisporangium melleum TaxID=321316 RepID=A0A917RDQ6_9ACTN|nr:hypothetical protein GCM10007964_50820 [Sphaerisporangium melleum]GII69505.1 hypothetical protein Sme01_19810 [Sphaerisporangium melleum]
MRAALRLLFATAALFVLVLTLRSHDGPSGVTAAPAAETLAEAAPGPAPADSSDHDGCPKPWEDPCASGWAKPHLPPSRHGGHPSQRTKPATEAAFRAAAPAAGVSALRRTRPARPRLPVFRC